MLTFHPSRIQGSKRHLIRDPGSVSATLSKHLKKFEIDGFAQELGELKRVPYLESEAVRS
jgi:hypothetical protein